jgi:hypothetical protein
MVAALLRVLNSGIQDSRLLPLKGNPNIELFSKVFIRAGRFTTQWVRLDFDTQPALGGKSFITIPRKGHLVSKLYLVSTMPDIDTAQVNAKTASEGGSKTFLGPYFTWTNSLGHALIQQINLTIGGMRVEQLDGRLMELLDEFYTPLEKLNLANELLKRNMTNFPIYSAQSGIINPPTVAITPIPLWFSRGDPGVYLPIDALAVDVVKLSIQFNPITSLYVSSAKQVIPPIQVGTAGAAYMPLASSPFYVADPSGPPVFGLTGDPSVSVNASIIPGVTMPNNLTLGDTYIMAEYIYLDAPEANRFRISDIEVPITQHYIFDPFDTKGSSRAIIPIFSPNPTRNIFFYAQRYEAPEYNAHFLATRDLSANNTDVPWWPNALPISTRFPAPIQPAFVFSDSEPLSSIILMYQGRLVRYATTSPSIFRSLIPSYEMKKSPFVNRYYYSLHFGLNHGSINPSQPSGEANLDKVLNISLQLEFTNTLQNTNPPRYIIYSWSETYNIFRIYAGRGALLFAY